MPSADARHERRVLGGAPQIRQLHRGAWNREVAGWIEGHHQCALLRLTLPVIAEIDVSEHEGGAAIAAILPGLVVARHALLQAGGLADIERDPAGIGQLGEDVVAGHVGPVVFESAHAVAQAIKVARDMRPGQILIVNLSGRGDKDVNSVREALEL